MYPKYPISFNLTITSSVPQTPCLLLGGMLHHDRLLSLWSCIQISLSSISCLSHVALLYQQKITDMQDMQVAWSVSVMSKAFANATTTLGKGFTNHLNFRSYQSLCFKLPYLMGMVEVIKPAQLFDEDPAKVDHMMIAVLLLVLISMCFIIGELLIFLQLGNTRLMRNLLWFIYAIPRSTVSKLSQGNPEHTLPPI